MRCTSRSEDYDMDVPPLTAYKLGDGTLGSARYRSLPESKSYIRLLQVLPSDDNDAPVLCTMKVVRSDEPGEYAAVSYMWGDPKPTEAIKVNDLAMSVGRNCRYALWQRRRFQPPGAWTWIDSVCINQEDVDEKSRQVAMMGNIFENAERVFVSLADEDNIGRCIAFYALRLGSGALSIPAGQVEQYVLKHRYDTYGERSKRMFLSASEEIAQGIHDKLYAFASQSYWRRVWVVQELKLARQIQIICGEHTMDALHVQALSLMRYDHRDLDSTPMMESFRKMHSKQGFLRAARWLTHLQCHDPRDRIYAMNRVFSWSPFSPPIVDYRKSAPALAADILKMTGRNGLKGRNDTRKGPWNTDPLSLAETLLGLLEIPIGGIASPVGPAPCTDVLGHDRPQHPQPIHSTCQCAQASVVPSAFRYEYRTLRKIGSVQRWTQLPSMVTDVDRPLYRLRPNVSLARPYFERQVVHTDYLLEATPIDRMKEGGVRYLILRAASEGIYEFIGLAFGHPWLWGFRHDPSDPEVVMLLDAQDVMTLSILSLALLGRDTKSATGSIQSIGSEPDKRLRETYKFAWLATMSFCRKPFSSCAISKDLMLKSMTESDIHPICADCGMWLRRRDEKTETKVRRTRTRPITARQCPAEVRK